MKPKSKSKLTAKAMALSSILAAVAVILVFLESIIPTNRLSLFMIASFIISIVIMESGPRAGAIFFAATSILILLIVPDKVSGVLYLGFFGNYGLIKFFIEKIKYRAVQIICKLGYFALVSTVILYLIGNFFFAGITFMPLWALGILFTVILMLYDIAYTFFIIYFRRIRHRIR